MGLGGDVMVVVNGVRIRRDEAEGLGIRLGPPPVPDQDPDRADDAQTKGRGASNKARTPANKGRSAATK